MVFISKEALLEIKQEQYRKGKADEVKSNERDIQRYEKEAIKAKDELEKATVELEALREARSDMRNVRKVELELEIKQDDVSAKEKLVDAKQKRLDSRLADLEKEQGDEYKKGYSDGVADGLRKVGELTEQDRNNMTKIAMVSAARGSNAAEIQGVTDVLQLTESNPNKKTSKS